jgi:cytochrome c oxidase subunit II
MRTAARRLPVRRAGILFFAAVVSLVPTGSAFAIDPWGMPSGVTEEAETIKTLYLYVTAMALAVFLAVEGALIYMVIRFRKKNDELPPQIHGNNALEIVWTAIPVIIVIALFVASFIVLVDVEEDAEDEALTINVEGFQFGWTFTYNVNDLGPGRSEDGSDESFSFTGTGGDPATLVIPMGEEVEFVLNSPDVIHSFYVSNFNYKLDVIPGRENTFTVTPNEEGTFRAQCAELCGVDHAIMRFNVEIKTREAFDEWVAEQREAAEEAAQRP